MRLYKAWSVVDNFSGQEQVRLDWFVVGRTVPLAPYAELIQNYDEEVEDSCYDQILVNELFAESELEELRAYLARSHRLDLQSEELIMPVKSGGLSYGLLLISGEKDFYTLADEEGYNLPLSILGHYDGKGRAFPALLPDIYQTPRKIPKRRLIKRSRRDVHKTRKEGAIAPRFGAQFAQALIDINTGIIFLEKVLSHLNLIEVDRSELAGVLRKIYAESGLHVTQNKQ